MGTGKWTKERSGTELLAYHSFLGVFGVIGRWLFEFPWWSLGIVGGVGVLLTIRYVVRQRRARERERALLKRFAE